MSGAATNKPKKPTGPSKLEVSERILSILRSNTRLFSTPMGAMWAAVPLANGQREVYPLYSGAVTEWLQAAYNRDHEGQGAISKFDIEPCLGTHSGTYRYDPNMLVVRDVVSRFGSGRERTYDPHSPHEVYLDLCDSTGRVVKVTRDGWKVVPASEIKAVHFQHTPGMLALPEPERGGSLVELRQFVNCPPDMEDKELQARSDRNWQTILAWLIGTMLPNLNHTGSYAHLAFFCAKGTGKTTVAQMLRDLVDPNKANLHQRPESPEDILRKASKGHVVAFDNLTSIPTQISDALSQLSTGLSDSKRRLYSNDDEIIYSVKGPAILNGTSDLVRLSDLAERTLRVELTPISDRHRRDEERLWEAYYDARPRILGALLDAAVAALKYKAEAAAALVEKPRHADLSIWLAASEYALVEQEGLDWERGTFAKVLSANRKQMGDQALASNAFLTQLLGYMRDIPDDAATGDHIWAGPIGKLYAELRDWASEKRISTRDPYVNWPATPQRMLDVLRREATELEERGFTMSESRRQGHKQERVRILRYHEPESESEPEQMAALGSAA